MRRRAKVGRMLGIAVLTIYAAVSLFPIAWMGLTSLKARIDMLTIPPKWIFTPTLQSYRDILRWTPTGSTWGKEMAFLKYYVNSVVITISATALALLVGIAAGYYLARYRTRAAPHIEFWVLSTRMAPPIIFLLAYFAIFVRIGLYDTLIAVILMSVTLAAPLCVWMMRSFIADVPVELEEAARIDGCHSVTAFFKVTLPLAAPGVAATAILVGIFVWNDLMFGLTLTAVNAKTVPVAVQSFVTYTQIYWGQLSASGVLAILPMLVFTVLVAKFIVRGLTFGALRE